MQHSIQISSKASENLKGNIYHIPRQENAKQFAFTTLRRVALSSLWKVETELKQMEDLGVISSMNEPTDWCTGMVVVSKSDGNDRICIDLTKLMQRKHHILPFVEQTLAQLGVQKLDRNSGF